MFDKHLIDYLNKILDNQKVQAEELAALKAAIEALKPQQSEPKPTF